VQRRTRKQKGRNTAGVAVRLSVTHTHSGKPYRAGDVVTVDGVAALWLIDHGIGQATDEQLTKDERMLT